MGTSSSKIRRPEEEGEGQSRRQTKHLARREGGLRGSSPASSYEGGAGEAAPRSESRETSNVVFSLCAQLEDTVEELGREILDGGHLGGGLELEVGSKGSGGRAAAVRRCSNWENSGKLKVLANFVCSPPVASSFPSSTLTRFRLVVPQTRYRRDPSVSSFSKQ
jgi:hypothetical protein